MIRIDAKAFVKSMKAAQRTLASLVFKSVEKTAEQAAAHAKVSPLYKFRTGALRSSIKHRTTGTESTPAAQTSASAKHAGWVENGTRAHFIRPRRKKWLRFEQNGAIRFAKVVRHPGTAPRPFMQRARDKVVPLFERLCVEAVNRMFG